MTTSTPKTLADLKFQDWVHELYENQSPEIIATEFLNCAFPDDRPVKVNFLFEENGTKVYEAYKDSGSDDYLYLTKKV